MDLHSSDVRLTDFLNMRHREYLTRIDEWLDGAVSDPYKQQPLAQDWARVAKVAEEVGESIDCLIQMTGQNPRKRVDWVAADTNDLLGELADVVITGCLAMQHFTKNARLTSAILDAKLAATVARIPAE